MFSRRVDGCCACSGNTHSFERKFAEPAKKYGVQRLMRVRRSIPPKSLLSETAPPTRCLDRMTSWMLFRRAAGDEQLAPVALAHGRGHGHQRASLPTPCGVADRRWLRLLHGSGKGLTCATLSTDVPTETSAALAGYEARRLHPESSCRRPIR